MKSTIAASLVWQYYCSRNHPLTKTNDPSATTASELFGWTALAAVATPVLLTASTGYIIGTVVEAAVDGVSEVGKATVKTTGQIVKLVGEGGESLSELTDDALTTASDVATGDSEVKVEINKKDIPLKVRKDYLQLNQKVKTE